MDKINFENLPSTKTPVSAENLNLLQTNVDNAKVEKTIIVTTAGTDLNNYTNEGRYYFDASHTPTNIPAGVNGLLEVLKSDNNFIKQIWYRHGTANTDDFETYVRTRVDATNWSSWKRFATASVTGEIEFTTNNTGITWKEPGYGDKFRIVPDFNGTGSGNKLKVQSTTGGQGTDPSTFTDLLKISADTGEIVNAVTNKVVPTASYFNDYIIARSISTAFSTSSSTGGSVNINATVPSGYKFLTWVGVASNGWISKGLYIENYNQQASTVFTEEPIPNVKGITCFYLCIKDA